MRSGYRIARGIRNALAHPLVQEINGPTEAGLRGLKGSKRELELRPDGDLVAGREVAAALRPAEVAVPAHVGRQQVDPHREPDAVFGLGATGVGVASAYLGLLVVGGRRPKLRGAGAGVVAQALAHIDAGIPEPEGDPAGHRGVGLGEQSRHGTDPRLRGELGEAEVRRHVESEGPEA